MANHPVKLVADEGVFKGLAKQNLLFNQCVCELIDNAIAASTEDHKFRIDIVFIQNDTKDTVDIYISDNCCGMDLNILKDALQLGYPPSTVSRLNEHGFGLKNSLATLSGENGYWKLWTKPITRHETTYTVEGPFKQEMVIHDDGIFPEEDFLPTTDVNQ